MAEAAQQTDILVAGPVTPDVARHMAEKGLTSIEYNAIIKSLGGDATEADVVLVASEGPNNDIKGEYYVALGEDRGTEILPDTAANLGLEHPDIALESIAAANHPPLQVNEIKPVGMEEVGNALFDNLAPTKHL